ncbi:MAG: DUF4198 domain-containing protein [Rhodoferax sp.]|nr:DUF4198 domain-containing protein [Rhodoferax sp.]
MTTKLYAKPLALLLALCTGAPLQAHEYWFKPLPNPLPLGSTAPLVLEVGEYFEGELVGFSAPKAASFQRYTATGREDLRALLPARQPVGDLGLPLGTPGTHLLAFDSQPINLELPAEKFHAYLREEGLDFVQRQREAAGVDQTPGRERFRRHIKTLIQVSPASSTLTSTPADATYAQRVGQRLEVMLLNDPLKLQPGEALGVRVLFDDQPLAGALVRAWHKRDGQTLIIRATTTLAGAVTFNLPYAGGWMVSVVHMVPAVGVQGIDWDSLWGNLTFSVPQPALPR